MLRDARPDLLVESCGPSPSAFPPGVHVCPWGAPDGRAVVMLIDRQRNELAKVYCPHDEEKVERVKAELQRVWDILDPPARPELQLIG